MDHLSSTIIMCAILVLFYASGTVKGQNIGDACTDDSNCTNTDAVCTSDKCACPTDKFLNTTSACEDKVGVNDTCNNAETSTDQCSDGNSTCSAGASEYKCFCTSAYYGESSTTCTPRKKPGETCAVYQCVANAMCNTTESKCACNTGYRTTSTSCESSSGSDAATIMLAHMYVFIFGTVASLYFLV